MYTFPTLLSRAPAVKYSLPRLLLRTRLHALARFDRLTPDHRRTPFTFNSVVIKARFLDALDRILLQSLMGQLWERGEGSAYMGTHMRAPFALFGQENVR